MRQDDDPEPPMKLLLAAVIAVLAYLCAVEVAFRMLGNPEPEPEPEVLFV